MQAIIETVSGRMVDVLNPQTGDFDIQDIATALSNLCRFNGQVKDFYSVAEHSFLLSKEMAPEHALYALLHDAAEAYVSDIVTPLKATLAGYDEIENRLLESIFVSLGIKWHNPEAWAAVSQGDLEILAMEKRWVYASSAEWPRLEGVKPLDTLPRWWTPQLASRMFMHQFQELSK